MNRCPKCGCTRISGPFYKKVWTWETLQYTCARCGFSCETPTLDAEEKIELQFQRSEG